MAVHCAIVLVVQPVSGQDGVDNAGPRIKEDTAKKLTVDTSNLINDLENHNPVPLIEKPERGTSNCGSLLFDKNYDWSEYERVSKAIERLVNNAETAWPELIRNFDDKRYSISYHNGVDCNYSVGDICYLIARGYLIEGYRKHFHQWFSSGVLRFPEQTGNALYYPDIIHRKRDIKKWCENRSNKQLYELQIEMSEWAIEKAAKLDFLTNKEREPFIRAIRTEINELRKSKKAVPFQGLYGEDYEPFNRETARVRTSANKDGEIKEKQGRAEE